MKPPLLNLVLPNLALLAERSRITAEMTHPKMQRRMPPSHPLPWRIARLEPPTQNVNSADCSRASACHFGGKIAKSAINVQILQ
jgi:hypothetical protein